MRLPLALLLCGLLSQGCRPAEGITVIDGLGREVQVPARIERVVTLAPNVTELVAAAGALDRIVGVDSESDYPPPVGRLPKVGHLHPSLEAIAALRPDLVIASTSGNPPSLEGSLAALGVPLYVVRTDRLDDIPVAIRSLGRLFGGGGEEVAAELEEDLAAPPRSGRSLRVLLMLWPDPLFVAGRETFVSDLLERAGGTNAVAMSGWPTYSMEALIEEPPDVILYPQDAIPPEVIAGLSAEGSLWNRVPAIRSGRLHPIPDDLVLRPGPRVAQGLAAIDRILKLEQER
ncbi:MAG: ABC transporter substrate-binding protein [Thermoanaerobaculia bacterium]